MKVSLFLKSNASAVSFEAYCMSKIVSLKLILKHVSYDKFQMAEILNIAIEKLEVHNIECLSKGMI